MRVFVCVCVIHVWLFSNVFHVQFVGSSFQPDTSEGWVLGRILLSCRSSDQGSPGHSPSIVHHLLGLFDHLGLHSGQGQGTGPRGIETQEKLWASVTKIK